MMPFPVREIVGRVQGTSIGGPDLDGPWIDEPVFDGVVLADNANASSPIHAVGVSGIGAYRIHPILQRECLLILQELVFGVHPFLSAAIGSGPGEGRREVICGEPCKRGRSWTRVALGTGRIAP